MADILIFRKPGDPPCILIRFLDKDGNQVDETITSRPWSPEGIQEEQEALLRVGPPSKDIATAELVPLLTIEGEEVALDELPETRRACLMPDTVQPVRVDFRSR